MKRLTFLLLFISCSLFITGCSPKNNDSGDKGNDKVEDELPNEDEEEEVISYKINGTKTFYAKDLWNIRDVSNNLILENNNLILKDKNEDALYESKAIDIASFEQLVMTWNVEDLNSNMAFAIAVGKKESFSDYFFMGRWSEDSKSSMGSSSSEFGSVNVDIFNNAISSNNEIKIRFNVTANDNNDVRIKNISVTSKRVNSKISYDESKLINKDLNVKPKQQLAIPSIGNRICSPTSLSMVIDYYNYNTDPVEVSSKVFDSAKSNYGNWTLNASYAGSFKNLSSRVEYVDDFSTIVNYIKNDIPVVLSIRTSSMDDLVGSIMPYPAGHLIVLKGFIQKEGVWYGIVNDPAEHKDELVLRHYDMKQLIASWRNYIYVVTDNNLN